MGFHAFAGMPGQVARLQRVYPEILSEGFYGVSQHWDIPVARWRAAKGFDASYPGNPHNTLSFIIEGASVERLDGRFAGLRGGAESDSFMLYTGGGSRRYGSRGDVRLCHLYFQTSLIQEIASTESDLPTDAVELRDDRIFARDLALRTLVDQYVARAMDVISPPSLLEMDARAVLFGLHLIRHHSNRACPERPLKGGLSPSRLATVFDYIEVHLAEDLPLAELASVANLSKRHFCGVFRQSTGMTPHGYVTGRRIERSKRLLAGPTPLAEIALHCGFGSQQHFTTVFRQSLGTTPGAVRAATRA